MLRMLHGLPVVIVTNSVLSLSPPTRGEGKNKNDPDRAWVPGSGEPLCVGCRFIQAVMTSVPKATLDVSQAGRIDFPEDWV